MAGGPTGVCRSTLGLGNVSQRARLPHQKAPPVNLLSVFRLEGFGPPLGAPRPRLMLGFYAAMTLIGTHCHRHPWA